MLELLLTMTLTGTAVSLLWLAACRLLGARLSAPWRYRGLRLSLVFWLVPVERCLTVLGGLLRMETSVNVPTVLGGLLRMETSVNVPTVLPKTFYRPALPAEPVSAAPEVWSLSQGAATLRLAAWGLGAAILLTNHFAAYRRFRKRLERQGGSEPEGRTRLMLLSCQQQVGVTGSVRLHIRTAAPTPFVMGLLRPVIVLSEQEFTRAELRCILLHELTHVKQGDQWTRRAALLVTALHWWNPAALIAKGVLDENGQYFKNSKGETYCVAPGGLYGPVMILRKEPVYAAAYGTRSERGCIRISDIRFEAPTDAAACPHVWELPLYDQEGNVIGTYEIGCGGHWNFSGMTVKEGKMALEAARTTAVREARAQNQ